MVTATPTAPNSFNNNKARTTATQLAKLRSQPIIVDLDAIPPPTSPLPIPNASLSPIIPVARTAPRKLSQDKIFASPAPAPCSGSGSLRPPPRPRSIVSHMSLSNPPIESLPPVPVLLHSNDSYLSSTPTSPTSPTGPSFFSAISPRLEGIQCCSLPSSVLRSASMGRVSETVKYRPGRKTRTASIATTGDNIPIQSEKQRARIASEMAESLAVPVPCDSSLMVSLEEPVNRVVSPIPIAREESKEADVTTASLTALPERPMCRTATRYYGIESSMRWREGVDPIQKRFSSSNGSWRCQDRFAVFFRPGDDIGPDQVVKKTFWSEAWPYPIETILYGTTAMTSTPSSTTTASTTAIAASSSKNGGLNRYSSTRGMETGEGERTGGYRSDHEGDRQISRGRTGSRQYSAGENVLKTAASFPSSGRSRDPRYITSEGVSKIAKVTIPMPDVAIDQMELVKAPVKVELCIYILESPLRVNATATLLGRTVEGTTELYV